MIGPAGENIVRIAVIMNQGPHRAFGRGGVGAVDGIQETQSHCCQKWQSKSRNR